MPIPPFPRCPSLPPNGVATTPHSLAVADALASEALHLLNAETDSLIAKAFMWLHLAAGEGDEWLRWLDYDPRWKRIREDPRFNKLKMTISATQKQQPTAPKTATAVNAFSGKAKDSDRHPHIWLISNHKNAARIGWSPIPGAAEYRLIVEPHGASAGLIQQFSLKGSVQKYRFPKLRQHGDYQIYLTALSDKGVEIETVECIFNL